MSNPRITREQQVVGSINLLVIASLATFGFGDAVELLPSYPYTLQKLDPGTAKVACGFTFDDGGKQFEMGSNMKERRYTIEFFVFAANQVLGESITDALKFSIEQDQVIPLYDVSVQPAVLTGEWLELDNVHSSRQPIPDPEPWMEFTFHCHCTVTDWYVPPVIL